MKKIISFSLYGNNPMYNLGCIENAKLKKEILKDWVMRVYYNNSVPQETITELEKQALLQALALLVVQMIPYAQALPSPLLQRPLEWEHHIINGKRMVLMWVLIIAAIL